MKRRQGKVKSGKRSQRVVIPTMAGGAESMATHSSHPHNKNEQLKTQMRHTSTPNIDHVTGVSRCEQRRKCSRAWDTSLRVKSKACLSSTLK